MWVVIGAAIALRIGGVTHGISFHPDERHIISVAEKMWREGDPNPHFFAYGSFPFYILVGFAAALKPLWPAAVTYDGLFVVGRLIAVVCGAVTVGLTYLLAKRASSDRRIGAIAALLLALNVFHLQLSRFYTVDIVLTALITAVLLVSCSIARGGGWRSYLGCGALLGLAAATKISALSLIAPIGAAVVLAQIGERRWWSSRRFGLAAAALGCALVVFAAAAPYSLLDYTTFLRHNDEQISMTRGLWRPPYTVQYALTPPYLYPALQMYRYTFGPPFALVVLVGFIGALLRQFRRPRSEEIVLLAGIIPIFVLVGGLQVKFPRYLLPLYPVLCVFGAVWLDACGRFLHERVRGRTFSRWIRYAPAALLGVWCTLYAAAFVGIYREPHVYLTASEWIYRHAPPGSRLLGVHWDDKLPVSMPGLSPHRFQYKFEGREHDLEVYEPESPGKVRRMAEQLAAHDYLIFPTARTYGSIPILPAEFPDTTRLFSALFKGELGYSLEQSFKTRPQAGPLVYNDDLADESFTVYDHPKVLVFRNTARLSADELSRRIALEGGETPLLSRAEMLLKDSAAPLGRGRADSSMGALVVWFALLELISVIVAPLTALALRSLPDRGYGASKALGLLGIGYLVWGAAWYGGAPTTPVVCWCIVGGCLAASHSVVRSVWGSWRAFRLELKPHMLTVEILCGAVFLTVAAIRAWSPEIFWGEKPMDFTFLNFFTRLTSLPPNDPWAAGLPMGYYYLSTFLFSVVHKLSGIDTAIGFNLALATVAAMGVGAAYSLGLWLVRSRRGALALALGVFCLSNWEVLRLALFSDRALNFDLFWASSRVLTSPAITEYPVWSVLFADLHAHVIALPFVVVVMVLACAPLSRPADPTGGRGYIESGLHGFVLGALFGLNAWDFVACSFLTGVVLVVRLVLADRGQGWWTGARDVISDGVVIALSAAIVVLPFVTAAPPAEVVRWGWVREEFSTLSQVTAHLGQWWVLIVIGVLGAAGRPRGWLNTVTPLRLVSALALGGIPCLLGVLSEVSGSRGVPWALLGAFSAFATGAALVLVGRNHRVEVRMMAALVFTGLITAAGAEVLYLIDRMNTIFKFYNFVWLSLGSGAFALAWRGVVDCPPAGAAGRWCVRGIGAVGVGAALIGSLLNLFIMAPFHRVEGPRPTLNGQAYLGVTLPDDAPLIAWLRKHVEGTPVVLEAHGDPYGPYTRISMHTGLPTVLGWEHHVRQRGASSNEVARRKRDIADIYSSTDIGRTVRLLKAYKVSLVVVSALERSTYPVFGIEKFARYPELFKPLYDDGGGIVYHVTIPDGYTPQGE